MNIIKILLPAHLGQLLRIGDYKALSTTEFIGFFLLLLFSKALSLSLLGSNVSLLCDASDSHESLPLLAPSILLFKSQLERSGAPLSRSRATLWLLPWAMSFRRWNLRCRRRMLRLNFHNESWRRQRGKNGTAREKNKIMQRWGTAVRGM